MPSEAKNFERKWDFDFGGSLELRDGEICKIFLSPQFCEK